MPPLSWTIGDVRVTRIAENEPSLPLHHLLPDATPEALEAHRSWLVPHFLAEDGRSILSIHALVVESSGLRILVDTCIGEHSVPGFDFLAPERSRFLEDLEAAGFARDTIDVVLCTHLHFDHVGWNTMRDGDRWVPTFPNARYLFAQKEWEHWQSQSERKFSGTFEQTVVPVVDAGLAELIEMDYRITDHVRLEPTPGHTPGHVAVWIESRGERALITGDLTHHPVQWAEPSWGIPADSDGAMAEQTRRRLLREHRDSEVLIIGTHYAPPCAGRLVSTAGGVQLETDQ